MIDLVLFVLLVLLSAADIRLTSKVLALGGRELNPVYGKMPSLSRLIAVRVIGLALLLGWLFIFPRARTIVLAIGCVMYAGVVAWNFKQSRNMNLTGE